jgi:hypothetical protein
VAVRPRRISDIKPILTNLAQTSHYEVRFGSLPPKLKTYLLKKGIDSGFISNSAGLLCYSASLPTTNLATSEITNYMGIREKFAHTRQYDDISLEFYVDKNYKMLLFLETWMEYIASGSFVRDDPRTTPNINQNQDGYFIRMQYPENYKANSVKIIKFDRDYKKEIEYNFRGFYPRNISSLQVSYSSSDTLKVSATFSYDRYIAGKTNSFSQSILGDSNNQDPSISQTGEKSVTTADDVFQNAKFGVSDSAELQSAATSLSQNPLGSQSNPRTRGQVLGYEP